MELGFSGHAFSHLILLLGFSGIIVTIATVIIVAKKRGWIYVSKPRFIYGVSMTYGIIFFVIPLFLSDIPIKSKIIGSIIALGAGSAYFFVMYYGVVKPILRNRLKDKKG